MLEKRRLPERHDHHHKDLDCTQGHHVDEPSQRQRRHSDCVRVPLRDSSSVDTNNTTAMMLERSEKHYS